MITVPAGLRVLIATKPVDFRRGADGLAALVRETLGEDPWHNLCLPLETCGPCEDGCLGRHRAGAIVEAA